MLQLCCLDCVWWFCLISCGIVFASDVYCCCYHAAGMQNFISIETLAGFSLFITGTNMLTFLWLLQVTACCIAYVSETVPNGVTFNAHMMAEFDVLLMQSFRLLHDHIFNPMISEFKQVAKDPICATYPDLCSIQTDTCPILHQKP